MAAFAFVSLPAFFFSWALCMTLASIWYSEFLFGNLCGFLSFGRRKSYPPSRAGLIASAVGNGLAFPFLSFFLDVVDCGSALEGSLWGLFLGFFNAGLNCMHCLFEDRPFTLYAIHASFHMFALATVGGCLGWLCTGAAA